MTDTNIKDTNNIKDTQVGNLKDSATVITDPKPITAFLVQLGKVLLAHTHHTEWLDAETITGLAKAHQIQLDNQTLTPGELEPLLMEYFATTPELFEDGVSAVGFNRRVGWDLMFLIRFDRFRVGCQPRSLGLLRVDGADVTPPLFLRLTLRIPKCN